MKKGAGSKRSRYAAEMEKRNRARLKMNDNTTAEARRMEREMDGSPKEQQKSINIGEFELDSRGRVIIKGEQSQKPSHHER